MRNENGPEAFNFGSPADDTTPQSSPIQLTTCYPLRFASHRLVDLTIPFHLFNFPAVLASQAVAI